MDKTSGRRAAAGAVQQKCAAHARQRWGKPAFPQGGCGLLECVSNLLSNEQFGGSQKDPVTAILDGMAALQKKLDAVVIVTNEVFTDRVPNDIAMQQYLQNLGNINQVLASRSDVVIEVCSGIPICWKGASRFHEIML